MRALEGLIGTHRAADGEADGQADEPAAPLARELRLLSGLALQISQNTPMERAFAAARPPVWDKRKPLLGKALQRHTGKRFNHMLLQAQQIDAQIKGQARGDPWNSLARLCLQLAGQRLPLEA